MTIFQVTRPRASTGFLALVAFCTMISIQVAAQTTETLTEGTAGSESVTAKPSDEISTASVDRQLIRELIVKYTNAEREKHGLQTLKQDPQLQELAEKHSRHMAEHDYFSHQTQREGKANVSFSQRVTFAELGYRRTAENIALQPIVTGTQIRTTISAAGEEKREVTRSFATYDELARETVEGWMKSEGHRKNILTPEFNLIGIGIGIGVRNQTPYAWITQNFGQN